MRNLFKCGVWVIFGLCVSSLAHGQYYDDANYQNSPYSYGDSQATPPAYSNQRPANSQQYYNNTSPAPNLQYDSRDAERILREQMERASEPESQSYTQQQPQMYDDYYGHRMHDEGQIQRVIVEAKNIGGLVRNRNGKAFIIIDKRNFQFYLFDREGRLLRVGPVAIGKGKTRVGAFETPVGVFPIRSKISVADWVRPDWYFIEEGEPVPARWEDRRVPGFFRYKLVFDGARYIHYAEATGGRLTHGCLGLDWQDAEAVFHTLSVGSYCIIADQGLLVRLARGEFPLPKPEAKPSEPKQEQTITARVEPSEPQSVGVSQTVREIQPKPLSNLW